MGWASYQEDIQSRLAGAHHMQAATVSRPVQAAAKAAASQHQHGAYSDMNNPVTELKEFTISSARPLPVILLADVSGSMAAEGKIDALNTAVNEMLAAFAEEDAAQAEIHTAIVTFGSTAALHRPLTPAHSAAWEPMRARGRTPMGAALDLATDLIEDREQIPSRAYRPTIVLVSDGVPTDDWRTPLQRLLESERAGKAQRFALAMGADANRDMLGEFLADPATRVFEAHEARQIKQFFRWVTMSVGLRSRSASPNQSVQISPEEIDDFDDF